MQVDSNLIGRQPQSHDVLDDGLIVNDYSFMHSRSFNDGIADRCRSLSPIKNRRYNSARVRTRSASPCRCSRRTCCCLQKRSPTPGRYLNLHSASKRFCHDYDSCKRDYGNKVLFPLIKITVKKYLEIHSARNCAICRLHRFHSEQSRRAKALEQVRYFKKNSTVENN